MNETQEYFKLLKFKTHKLANGLATALANF